MERSAVEGLTHRLFEALRNRSGELAALEAEKSTGMRPTPRRIPQQGARQSRQQRARDFGMGSTPPQAQSSDDRCTPRPGTVASSHDRSLSARRLGGGRARSAHTLGVHSLSACRSCCDTGVDLAGQPCTCVAGPNLWGRTPPPSEASIAASQSPAQSMPQVFRRLTAPQSDESMGEAEADNAAPTQASAYLEALLEAHELATGQPATSSRKVYCEELDP